MQRYTIDMQLRHLALSPFLFLATFFLVSPSFVSAQVNAGFIPAPIWFGNQTLIAEQTTTISTLVYNQGEKALYGAVGFYDNDKLLGKKTITVEARSSKVASITWKITVGDHAISAKFENVKQTNESGPKAEVENSTTDAYRFTVDPLPATVVKTETKDTTTENATAASKTSTSTTKEGGAVGTVKDTAQTAFESVDTFREKTAETLEKKVKAAEEEVKVIEPLPVSKPININDDQLQDETNDQNVNAPKVISKKSLVDTPFSYIKLYFYKLAHYIFDHKAAFYGLIILIFFMIIRHIVRAQR